MEKLIIMKKLLFLPLLTFYAFISVVAQDIEISTYKLENGLTIILNEDHSQPSVFGCVAVRAGSKDDPDDATGLAHYMEHVMFKGTQDLGTYDWGSEKPHYEKIIELYEELRKTEDPEKKKEINNQINQQSLAAGKYAIPNEFSNLTQAMGETGLNAGTGYDYTMYHNSFPPFQIRRWLDLYAHRFINPVFRGFQSELETVYEEKNMYSDNPSRAVQNDFLNSYFGEDNPYGRLILGKTEHLKNPSIKRIIEFYNDFYVPSNMALVLSGDINPETLKPMIEATFGKWEKRELTAAAKEPESIRFSEPIKVKTKQTPYPMLILGYPAVSVNNADKYTFEFCTRLLSNKNRTGLLDKLVLEGDFLFANASFQQFKYDGMVMIQAVPTFDVSQMKYVSLSVVEKEIEKEIEKLKKGEFDDWLIDAFKKELAQEYDMLFESPSNMGYVLMQNYAYNIDINNFLNYKNKIESITKEDILRVANDYFTENKLTYLSDIGNPKKEDINKPDYSPIEPIPGKKSDYAKYLEQLPLSEVKEDFVNFDKDVQEIYLADKVKLNYTQNPKNDIFSLTIKFGVGTGKIPSLGMATQLMNYAGVLAQYKPQELKNAYSKLGCTVNFYSSESYLYISMLGDEENLGTACQLLSRTFLMPELDEKQMKNVIGGVLGSRRIEKTDKSSQASALFEYLLYGDNSPELNRLSDSEIQELTISDLTGDFISATHYEASIHYVGKLPFNKTTEILRNNLVLPANLEDSESPYIRKITERNKETILFLNNPDARQSEISILINGPVYKMEDQATVDAFNQYFGGGFNGLVLQELREKRSFAYTASARFATPTIPEENMFFIGTIGTQADKTADAVSEFVKIIKEMPEKPERINNIENYLVQSSQASKPGFRNLSQTVENWKIKGYTIDPNQYLIPQYKNLSFEDIKSFYQDNISNQPITIAIVGNKKLIDMDKLETIAKVVKVNPSKIFKN